MLSRVQNNIFQRLNFHCQRFLCNLTDQIKLTDESFKTDDSTVFSKCTKPSQEFSVDENGYVIVYTDGACASNGLKDAKAGIGVWFGDNHPLNISKPITGRATCNVAEISAATEAIKQAKKLGIQKIKLHTDSQFLISCMTNWMHTWKENGWKRTNKQPVVNQKELMELDEVISSVEVDWVHVSSHAGVHGNEMANTLAQSGIKSIKSKE